MYFAPGSSFPSLDAERQQRTRHFVRLDTNRLSGRETRPDVIDYELIRNWLALCSETHGKCVERHMSLDFHDIRGFCLIDCSTRAIVPATQACEREYVTLSYVWGSSSDNSSPASGSSLPDKLPLVVEDAIKVTRNLGYRYIWVDRYCIAQDNPMIKHDQIRSMGKIYSSSVLTIIAAAGLDAEYGLPGVSSRARIQQFVATCDDGRTKLTAVHFAKDEITHSKWHSRGWTFQEAVMAKRRLAFTDRKVFFQCQETYTSDDWNLPPNTFGVPDQVYAREGSTHFLERGQSYEHAWHDIQAYLKRDLTYDSDALNAIAGVLSSFPAGQVRFLSGLPISSTSNYPSLPTPGNLTEVLDPLFAGLTQNDFHPPGDVSMAVLLTALLWRNDWVRRGSKPEGQSTCVRRSEFPSWTWAGWKVTDEWEMRFSGPTILRLTLSSTEQLIRTNISFTFQGSVLSWPDASEEILDLSHQGRIPTSNVMTIVGKVFDIKIKCTDCGGERFEKDSYWWRKGFVWSITDPPFMEVFGQVQGLIHPPPGILREKIGETQDLLALLLTVRTLSVPPYKDHLGCKFLLLRPVEEGIDGHIYERVTSCDAYINMGKFMQGKKEQQSDTPYLQLRTMKVAIR